MYVCYLSLNVMGSIPAWSTTMSRLWVISVSLYQSIKSTQKTRMYVSIHACGYVCTSIIVDITLDAVWPLYTPLKIVMYSKRLCCTLLWDDIDIVIRNGPMIIKPTINETLDSLLSSASQWHWVHCDITCKDAIYIYIYICVCVCVCLTTDAEENTNSG